MFPGLFKLSLGDLGRGVFTAFVGAVIVVLYNAFNTGIPATWAALAALGIEAFKVGFAAGIAYLLKNFVTNSEGKIAKAEPKQPELKLSEKK